MLIPYGKGKEKTAKSYAEALRGLHLIQARELHGFGIHRLKKRGRIFVQTIVSRKEKREKSRENSSN